MNANKRLEEFILKLSIRQQEHGQFNSINNLKTAHYYNDPIMSDDNINNESNINSSYTIDKDKTDNS